MNDDAPDDTVRTGLDDGVLTVTLNRPAKKNALTNAMYQALADAFAQATGDNGVGAILLTGSAECFTAGNDLGDFLDRPPGNDSSPVFGFLERLSSAEKPIVAAVAGPAVGIGTTALLHCDLVFAAPNARFQLPFVQLGLCPEAASSLLLPRHIGYHKAAELLLLGEPLDAETACAIGLINAVVEPESLIPHALAKAKRLAELPANSVRLTKSLLKQAEQQAIAERIRLEGEHFAERLRSPEAKAAFQAFFAAGKR